MRRIGKAFAFVDRNLGALIGAAFLLAACVGGRPETTPGPLRVDTLYVTHMDTVSVVHFDTVTIVLSDTVRVIDTVQVVATPVDDSLLIVRWLRVKPDTVTLQPGQQQQFCPFVVYGDGQWTMPAPYHDLPVCTSHWLAIASQWRKPTTSQQSATNRMCITFVATGGTVTAVRCE